MKRLFFTAVVALILMARLFGPTNGGPLQRTSGEIEQGIFLGGIIQAIGILGICLGILFYEDEKGLIAAILGLLLLLGGFALEYQYTYIL